MFGIIALRLQDDGGLTLREIVQNIPHDAAAVVVYVLIAVFAGFIWMGTRGQGNPPPTDASGKTPTGTPKDGKADEGQGPP